ncbi:Membrane protease YdiL, CAAX protease family [Actinopolyspora lacussalsi subsp. righensis]|uniref:Membrane protease YdiL, CAAX protease family n=1 Tax=Actinopolyspora righensis TaxID=995060 RepID=A0A1I7AHV4_9ACTN|nr:Membrane protease YdiL, CAAX protease family [Actinopolyspora righensis]
MADPAAYPSHNSGDSRPVSPRRPPPKPGFPAPVPEGTPFHLLARNSAHRWWRPVVALLVLLGLTLAASVLAAVLLVGMIVFAGPLGTLNVVLPPGHLVEVLSSPLPTLFLSFAVLIALIPPVALTARWVQRRGFGSVVGVLGTPRVRWFGETMLWALLVFGVLFAAIITLQLMSGAPMPAFPGWRRYLAVALLAVLVVPAQSAAEELFFRGLLLQTLTAWFRTPWPGILLSSLVFLLGHGYTDPLVWVELFLMATIMCWLSIRTGGLEAAVAMHTANNALSLLVAGLSGVPSTEQSGDYPVIQVIPMIVAVLLFAWVVDRRAARRGVGTVVGGRVRIDPVTLAPRH